MVGLGRPAAEGDLVGAIGDDFDGPVAFVFFLGEGLFFVIGVSAADVALVPRRSGVEPVVCGEG